MEKGGGHRKVAAAAVCRACFAKAALRAIYNEIVNVIEGNRATYGIQGNAFYDTPVGQLRFPVTVYSR